MNNNTQRSAGGSAADISDWRPEDDAFWAATGKKIAYRNLWISIPALLCGFAVWGMWGIITVQMLNLGYPFTQAELFTLTAARGSRSTDCGRQSFCRWTPRRHRPRAAIH